jgi:acyl-CoA reductase-like NAD-dependent aldehyde dehydrogenase
MTNDTARIADAERVLTDKDLTQVAPLINGRITDSDVNQTFIKYSPASGQKLLDIPIGCAADVDKAVAAARYSHESGAWAQAPPSAKKAILHRWADLIERNAIRLDALDACEMGKPISVRPFNAHAAAGFVRFNAEALDKFGGKILSSDHTSTVMQKRVPRGVIGALVPWNFPTYNCVLKAAPALAAGNSIVLKPSELASLAAISLAQLAFEAGLPPGAFNIVPGCGETVGRALAAHMDVDMITFTGSSATGKRVMQYAGQSNLKVVSAECGGKSPHIVFDDDIDLDAAAQSIASGLVLNQGQVCSVGSRLLVEASIEGALIDRIIKMMREIRPGDPQLPSTTYGPLVSKAQMETVMGYIDLAKQEDAEVLYGGSRLLRESGGYYLEPTLLRNVSARSAVACEEIFGPVLSVFTFQDFDQAVDLANGTPYGLAAYVWASKMSIALKMSARLKTSVTMVNAVAPCGEGPGMAFSGEPHGASGVGVEGGVAGFETFTRRQTIWLNHG